LIKYLDKNQEVFTIDDDAILQKAISDCSENFLNFGLSSGVITLRIVVQFTNINPKGNHRN